MEKIKVLQVGVGNFGASWASDVIPSCADCVEFAGIVDRDASRLAVFEGRVPTFRDIDAALEAVQPDLVLNVTPPGAHLAVTEQLMKMGYPVLCEKPVADDREKAKAMLRLPGETGGFLMISENYRYHRNIRAVREQLASGRFGKIHRMTCSFHHYHPDYSRFYHGKLTHPLMQDVTIHHLDLARYISGEEPAKVWCREYTAPYCWYGSRPASASIITEMTNGVLFSYDGTLASPVSTTDWDGRWEIECDGGMIEAHMGRVTVYTDKGSEIVAEFPTDEESRGFVLREACCALKEGRTGETDISDNIKTFRWMMDAIRSAEEECWIDNTEV